MTSRRLIAVSLALGLGWTSPAAGIAQAAAEEFVDDASSPAGGAGLPSLAPAGLQPWADELFFHQWRIQRNVVSGDCRLLDERAVRHASGTYEQCRAVLDQVKRREHLPPMRGKAVVVLHGLGRSRATMSGLAKHLEEQGGYAVFNVGYPSTHRSIGEHAQALAGILEHLDGIDEINFVAHSMGNIVVRRYLSDQTDPTQGRRADPRIKRFVMLGPPNHGSIAATALADNPLFTAVLGKPGQELGRQWVWLEGSLATPQCEFGVIAGGLGNRKGYNPLLPGDDDGVVTVQSTRLDGAKDFVLVPVLHSPLVNDSRVQRYTLQFLKTGRFRP